MIEDWISRSSQNRRWMDESLIGRPAKWITPQHDFWIYLVTTIVTALVWAYSFVTTVDSVWSPSPELVGQAGSANSLLYAYSVSTTEAFAVLVFLLVVLRCSFLRSPVTALLGLFSALLAMVVVGNVSHFVLIEADWDVIWANRKILMFGPHLTSHPEELWRFWPSIYLLALLLGGAYGSLGESPRKFLIPFTLFALISLFALYNPNHRTYDYESTMVKLSMAFAVTYISFLITHKKLTGADEYLIVRFHRWLTITAVITFFVTLTTLDPPGDDTTIGSVEITGVSPSLWGGFVMNVLVATAGCVLGFGLGIVLAFGRRSNLAAYRYPSTAIIELIRSGPLVAWLFIAFILLPDVLNPIWESDVVSRMILIISIFGGCYGAEIIRGGLQAVPFGQIEAATALGLSNMQTKLLVELPNAIRTTLPTIVSLFIGLWKDTTLLYLLGVHEMFNLATLAIAQQKEFLGMTRESLVFAGMAFWIVAFYLSRISLRIESGLGLGHEGGGEAT